MTDIQETVESAEPTETSPRFDVFIIFSTKDIKLMKNVCSKLKEHPNRPQKCLTQYNTDVFRPGRSVFKNIEEAQTQSRTTLLILTKDALDSNWLRLEIILLLEKSHQRDTLFIRVLINGACEEDVAKLKTVKKSLHLPDEAYIVVDFNEGGWVDRVIDSITGTIRIKNVLPVGNLAHGQAFSHFVGYLRHILPDLKSAIEGCATFRANAGSMSTKYYILLPESSEVKRSLVGQDDSSGLVIESEGILKLPEVDCAGKLRKQSPTIYSIRKQNKTKKFYFLGEFPGVLDAIFKMRKFIEFEVQLQIVRFYFTMNEVLNHNDNQACNDIVEFLPYNDEVQSMEKVLYDAVKQDVQLDTPADVDNVSLRRTAPQRLLSQPTKYEKDAVIFCSESDEVSSQIAMEIHEYLTINNKKVDLERQRWVESIDTARWNIFILSCQSLTGDKCINMKCMSAMADGVANNDLRTIPVLVGDLKPDKLPRFIKWVTVLCSSEMEYRQKLLQTINGGPIKMEHRMPAGDVATGLAWSYAVNYLPITLKDLKGRIQCHLRDKKLACGCIHGLFILIPKSCYCPNSLQQVEDCLNHGYVDDEVRVKSLGKIEDIVIDAAGHEQRHYCLYMYQYTNTQTDESVCFLCEFATPANNLHEMANHYKFAGLMKDAMYRQVEEFKSLVEEIVRCDDYKREMRDISQLVKLVLYDDGDKKALLRTLRDEAGLDDSNQKDLLYACDTTDCHKPCDTTDSHKPCDTMDSLKLSDTTDSHKPCDTMDSLKPCDTMDSLKLSDTTDRHNPCDTTDSLKFSDTTDSHKPCDTTDSHKPCDTTDSHKLCDTTDSHKPCDTTDSHMPCATTDSHKPCDTTDSHKPCDTTDSHKPCDTTDSHKPCDTTDSHKPCDTTDSHKPCDTTDSHKPCDTTGRHKPCDTTDSHKPCDTMDSLKLCDTMDSLKLCDTMDSQKPCDTMDSQKPCDTMDSLKLSDTMDSLKLSDTTDSHKPCDTMDSLKLSDTTYSHKPCDTLDSLKLCHTMDSLKLSDTTDSQKPCDTTDT